MPRARRLSGTAGPASAREYGARNSLPWPRGAPPRRHSAARPAAAESRLWEAPTRTRYHTVPARERPAAAIGAMNAGRRATDRPAARARRPPHRPDPAILTGPADASPG